MDVTQDQSAVEPAEMLSALLARPASEEPATVLDAVMGRLFDPSQLDLLTMSAFGSSI